MVISKRLKDNPGLLLATRLRGVSPACHPVANATCTDHSLFAALSCCAIPGKLSSGTREIAIAIVSVALAISPNALSRQRIAFASTVVAFALAPIAIATSLNALAIMAIATAIMIIAVALEPIAPAFTAVAEGIGAIAVAVTKKTGRFHESPASPVRWVRIALVL
jgi:hypothetical protein